MKLFSQRNGYKPARDVIQKESMDDELRTALWNAYYELFCDQLELPDSFIRPLWTEYFHRRVDTLPDYSKQLMHLRSYFFRCEWYEVYDLLEFGAQFLIAQWGLNDPIGHYFHTICNDALKNNLSAYRLVNGYITEITSEEEIASIEDAIASSPDPVREHLEQALKLFSDRDNPDYRNSIKESISAVEALSSKIAGISKAKLGLALKKIENEGKISLHGSLKGGFEKLYGYTSDGDGIRHALMDESNLDAEDAKFMLVSCSAFINYLIVKADKAGISF